MGGPYRIRIVNRGFGVALSLLTVSAVAQITPISFGSPAVATKITAQTYLEHCHMGCWCPE